MPAGRDGKKKPPRHGFACHPSCRGELISYSPQRGVPVGRGGSKEHEPDISEYVTPICRGELTYYSACDKGCPQGGVGERKHPDISEYVTPLQRGINLFFLAVRGCPQGGVGKSIVSI